jgi:hypothetical protein
MSFRKGVNSKAGFSAESKRILSRVSVGPSGQSFFGAHLRLIVAIPESLLYGWQSPLAARIKNPGFQYGKYD